jgi:curved DNA-binding protein CbpA
VDRETILIPADCELRRLPLDAVEAFVLSQLDGRLTLEEIGEVVGLDLVKTLRLAERLIEVGAAKSVTRRASKTPPRADGRHRMTPGASPTERISLRSDPRAEKLSARPGAGRIEQVISVRVDPRIETISVRPPRMKSPSLRPEPRKESRRSMRSMRAVRGASGPEAARARVEVEAKEETCELDETTCAELVGLDTKMGTRDHYAVLGVDRGAEKREIKRAYFAMASKYHPDRFFGEKLGKMRAAVQRIFIRMTEAHDTLTVRARREEYDAALPPPRKHSHAPVARLSKKMKARLSSAAFEATTSKPAAAKASVRPAPAAPARTSVKPPPSGARQSVKPPSSGTGDVDKFNRLQATARLVAAQSRADVFLRAAEEALQRDDVISAANNFRLALQFADDPFVRRKLEAVEEVANARRLEKSLLRARAAERNERWDEAAHHFAKANEVRASAATAERAAYAFRRSGSDLQTATKLAEQAVSLDAKNVACRVTLGEIYLTAGLTDRAKAESDQALELAPKDPRAQELAALLRKRK